MVEEALVEEALVEETLVVPTVVPTVLGQTSGVTTVGKPVFGGMHVTIGGV